MIPHRLVRTVPAETSAEVEAFWAAAGRLMPGWRLVTLRDPLDPAEFPLTSPAWPCCEAGAQMAGLVRLEYLWRHGGVYIDSDVELYRPLDALTGCSLFVGWEDCRAIPDAVIGAKPRHPAIRECIRRAIDRLPEGPSVSGPLVLTEVLPTWPDVLQLPPGSFYPYHYTEKHRRHEDHRSTQPWAFGAHHWAGSWLTSPS